MARPLPRHPLIPVPPWRQAVRRARRSLAVRWLLVAGAAALVAVEGSTLHAAAARERDAWGSTATVVIARHDLALGDVVEAGDVEVNDRPIAVIPDGALTAPPVGEVVTASIVAGEVVVDARIAPSGLHGAAALVPDGWRAVAVPTSTGFGVVTPPLRPGDRVDVLAPEPVVTGALVVAVDADVVTVAVPADDAPDVAEAVTTAVVTLALIGPG